jgi:hypothetical protein
MGGEPVRLRSALTAAAVVVTVWIALRTVRDAIVSAEAGDMMEEELDPGIEVEYETLESGLLVPQGTLLDSIVDAPPGTVSVPIDTEPTPTDAMTAHLPPELHFIGGPFDGLFFHPAKRCAHDVNGSDAWINGRFLITADPNVVGYVTADLSIAAVYRRESDRNWAFLQNLDPEQLA